MLSVWLTTAALASVTADDRWIGNSNLSVGLHQDGSFINNALDLGILWDPDGPDGAIPMTGDMLRVGYYWDGWAWSYWGEAGPTHGFQAGPHNDAWTAMTWTEKVSNSALTMLSSEMSLGDVDIKLRSIALDRQDLVIQDFTVTATATVSLMSIGRTLDPDQDEWLIESRVTDNESGEGWASAASRYDERTVALAGGVLGGAYGTGGICSWCTTTSSMEGSGGESSIADQQIYVLASAGTLHSGDSATIRFVYAFEIGAGAAQDAALDGLDLMDIDGDGLTEDDGDCDDLDPDVFEGATELEDLKDNDCDGSIDEGTLGADDDGDGFSEADGDCDDDNPEVYPGAEPADGLSNADCDGVADDVDDDEPDEEEPDDEPDEEEPDEEEPDDEEPDEEEPDDEPDGNTDEDADNSENTPDSSASDARGLTVEGEKHQSCSHATASHSAWLWLIGLISVARRRRGDS